MKSPYQKRPIIDSIKKIFLVIWNIIYPLSSPYAEVPAQKYGYVKYKDPSPGEPKELIKY